MKLRFFVFLLALANLVFFAYVQGWFGLWGWQARAQSEPQHLQNQLHPDALALVQARNEQQKAARDNPTQCLLSPLLGAQMAAPVLKQIQASLPAQSWQSIPLNTPGRWMIYMGRYPDEQAVARKKDELKRFRVSAFDTVPPAYQPGFSLGGFDDLSHAEAALKENIRKAEESVAKGKVIYSGTPEEFHATKNPVVRDFIEGNAPEDEDMLALMSRSQGS